VLNLRSLPLLSFAGRAMGKRRNGELGDRLILQRKACFRAVFVSKKRALPCFSQCLKRSGHRALAHLARD